MQCQQLCCGRRAALARGSPQGHRSSSSPAACRRACHPRQRGHGLAGPGEGLCGTRHGRRGALQVCGALFEPPEFQPDKLSVEFLPGASPRSPPPPFARRYTLTHNDLTGALRLSIGAQFNARQVRGFYTRVLRDEVVAEWRFGGGGAVALPPPGAPALAAGAGPSWQALQEQEQQQQQQQQQGQQRRRRRRQASSGGANGSGGGGGGFGGRAAALGGGGGGGSEAATGLPAHLPPSLHVFCHVSGEERWLAPPQLRNFIFRREMTLVLDTFLFADRELLAAHPALARADVLVHFQSADPALDAVEHWGTLGDRRSWQRMPKGVAARLALLLRGFPDGRRLARQPCGGLLLTEDGGRVQRRWAAEHAAALGRGGALFERSRGFVAAATTGVAVGASGGGSSAVGARGAWEAAATATNGLAGSSGGSASNGKGSLSKPTAGVLVGGSGGSLNGSSGGGLNGSSGGGLNGSSGGGVGRSSGGSGGVAPLLREPVLAAVAAAAGAGVGAREGASPPQGGPIPAAACADGAGVQPVAAVTASGSGGGGGGGGGAGCDAGGSQPPSRSAGAGGDGAAVPGGGRPEALPAPLATMRAGAAAPRAAAAAAMAAAVAGLDVAPADSGSSSGSGGSGSSSGGGGGNCSGMGGGALQALQPQPVAARAGGRPIAYKPAATPVAAVRGRP